MITPLATSPFDVNGARRRLADATVPYTSVTVEDVTGLVQDAIFSRGPEGVKRTAMFIGALRAAPKPSDR
jgi:methylene-tetrahydromethanopterin dehydrogenase